jgi:hypothetical protein
VILNLPTDLSGMLGGAADSSTPAADILGRPTAGCRDDSQITFILGPAMTHAFKGTSIWLVRAPRRHEVSARGLHMPGRRTPVRFGSGRPFWCDHGATKLYLLLH